MMVVDRLAVDRTDQASLVCASGVRISMEIPESGHWNSHHIVTFLSTKFELQSTETKSRMHDGRIHAVCIDVLHPPFAQIWERSYPAFHCVAGTSSRVGDVRRKVKRYKQKHVPSGASAQGRFLQGHPWSRFFAQLGWLLQRRTTRPPNLGPRNEKTKAQTSY